MSRYGELSDPSPVEIGRRVEFIAHGEPDPDPLSPGEQGTVTGGNGMQLYVNWDSGRSLILLPGIDRFRVLPHEADRQVP